jgi:hypothetical protein
MVVVKIGVNDRLALVNVAEALGLGTFSVDAPWTSNKKLSPDRWIFLDETPSGSRCEKLRSAARSKQAFASEQTETQTPKQLGPKFVLKEKTKAPGAARSGSEPMLPPATGIASAPSR